MKRLAAFGGILMLIATLQAQGLGDLYRPRAGVSRRVSSYDRTGGNQDTVELKPGEKRPLADIAGSGVVRHIWMTINSQDPSYLRSLVIRFFWDGEREPSIEVPVGDLFGLGLGVVADFNSAPISVVRAPHLVDPPGRGALNLFFPMPFSTRAQIESENQSPEVTCVLYYYVDYDALPRPPDSTLRFHAVWRQELLAVPAGITSSPGNVPNLADHKLNSNTTGKSNYVVLDAKGRGHYVGCVLSVDSRGTDPGKWWEGDDMIFVDDDTWPPSIHGTGTEDYFSLAWGFRGLPTRLYHGIVLLEKRPTDARVFDGRFTAYRFHIEDAIVFQKALRVTLEHGHANDAGVRYASTAYWYQIEPHTRQPALPPRGSRGWSQ